jgi:hypothetical protein
LTIEDVPVDSVDAKAGFFQVLWPLFLTKICGCHGLLALCDGPAPAKDKVHQLSHVIHADTKQIF